MDFETIGRARLITRLSAYRRHLEALRFPALKELIPGGRGGRLVAAVLAPLCIAVKTVFQRHRLVALFPCPRYRALRMPNPTRLKGQCFQGLVIDKGDEIAFGCRPFARSCWRRLRRIVGLMEPVFSRRDVAASRSDTVMRNIISYNGLSRRKKNPMVAATRFFGRTRLLAPRRKARPNPGLGKAC